MPFAEVALPLPLRRTFTYRIPDPLLDRAAPGVQVQVPFRGRAARGVLVAVAERTALDGVRDLGAVLADAPLSAHLLELARWIAEYYVAPPGEVLAAMLPGGLAGFSASRARRAAVEDPIVRLALGSVRRSP